MLTVIVSVCVLGLAMSIAAAPRAELWPRWQQHHAQKPAQIDFTFWHTFLARSVDAQHPSGIHRRTAPGAGSAGLYQSSTWCVLPGRHLHLLQHLRLFQEDFGGNIAGVVQHLLRYANAPLTVQLQAYRGKVKHEFDWRLNAP
jgi:hypothetical protein